MGLLICYHWKEILSNLGVSDYIARGALCCIGIRRGAHWNETTSWGASAGRAVGMCFVARGALRRGFCWAIFDVVLEVGLC